MDHTLPAGKIGALPDQTDAPKNVWLWWCALLVVLMLVYRPALKGGFVWDDPRHVADNRMLQSLQGLGDIWWGSLWPFGQADLRRVTPQYYPLTHTTFWLEYHLWGLRTTGYHVVNVLLHALSAGLLWRLLRHVRVPGAFVATALWVLHPMQVESVAWISERKNVLSGLFYIAGVWAFVRSEDDSARKNQWYALSFGLFVAALLSKTVASTLPGAVAVLLWWRTGILSRKTILRLVPFVIVGAAFSMLTAHLERAHVGAVGPDWAYTLTQRVAIAGRAIWFYPAKLLWPSGLAFNYQPWDVRHMTFIKSVLPAVAAVALVILLWMMRRRIGRGPVAAALLYGGIIFPALGFFNIYPMRYAFVADHFQYLAGIALIALAVAGGTRLLGYLAGPWPRIGPMVAAILLLVCGILSAVQAGGFADETTLWQRTLQVNPQSWLAHYNLGTWYFEKGREAQRDGQQVGNDATEARRFFALARQHYEQTLQIRPQHAGALNNMGNLESYGAHPQAARHYFQQATQYDPAMSAAWVNLARMNLQLRQPGEAMAALNEATRAEQAKRQPDGGMFGQIGLLWDELGQGATAVENYDRALRLRPEDAKTMLHKGLSLARSGRNKQAMETLSKVVTIDPRNADAYSAQGYLYGQMGAARPAMEAFAKALLIDKDHPQARRGMRLAMAALRPASTTQAAP